MHQRQHGGVGVEASLVIDMRALQPQIVARRAANDRDAIHAAMDRAQHGLLVGGHAVDQQHGEAVRQ